MPTPLVVKNGSKIRAIASGAMPEPVSDTETATKAPGAPARGGTPAARRTWSSRRPWPSMASRAFAAKLTSAVSNWFRSARTWQPPHPVAASTATRVPTRVWSIGTRLRTRSPALKGSGASGWRRALVRQ